MNRELEEYCDELRSETVEIKNRLKGEEQMKPREIIVILDGLEQHMGGASLIIRMCIEHISDGEEARIERPTGPHFLAREIIPIDWEKVWNAFDIYLGDNGTFGRPDMDKIQELVEKQIRGE